MADRWVRPFSGGPYGSNDGTSYDDAWYRARDISLSAGDTLYVSGTLDDGGSDGYSFTQIFRSSSVEGTSSNPITIDGAPVGKTAGRIVAGGVNKINTGDWTNEGSGVWSVADVGGAATWLYNEVESWPNSDRFIYDFGSVPTAGDAPAYHVDGANKLWYAPLTGTPTSPVWTSGGAFLDFFSATNTDEGLFNPDWLIIKNLTLRNFANPIRTMHNQNWVIDNVDIGWCPGTGIDPRDGTESLTIQNCEIHNCINGIYSSIGSESNGVSESANGCLVKDNNVHDIRPFLDGGGDCHGVAWQNGSNNKFTGNTVEDVMGTGITVYIKNPSLHASRESRNNEIDNNTVRRIQNLGQSSYTPNSSAVGIEWTGENSGRESSVESDNLIHNNIISFITKETSGNEDHGWAIRAKAPRRSLSVYGNTVSDSTYGLYLYSQNVNGGAASGAAGALVSGNQISDCTHNIGYNGSASTSGYSLALNTYSGGGDFEVLKDTGSSGLCSTHSGTWDYPSTSQCRINTVGQYFLYTQSTYMNEYQGWRGAVEPAESGAIGNEVQLWRGAVEPTATTSTADALVGGVTRSVTRTLTRGVTEGWDWGA